jgi:protein TonB
MLAYAANRPVPGKRQSSPNALLIVISVHVALLAIVMSAKMELPPIAKHPPIDIFWVPKPKVPPPPTPQPPPGPRPQINDKFDDPRTEIKTPPIADQQSGSETTPDAGTVLGGGTATITDIRPPVLPPIHHDPRLLTPPSELKPPYPASKLLSEEEAVLRLRLSISDDGRVIAVDPVGPADRTFLDAARRHLIAHWRYQPATEDGRTIASSIVITLRFELNG